MAEIVIDPTLTNIIRIVDGEAVIICAVRVPPTANADSFWNLIDFLWGQFQHANDAINEAGFSDYLEQHGFTVVDAMYIYTLPEPEPVDTDA